MGKSSGSKSPCDVEPIRTGQKMWGYFTLAAFCLGFTLSAGVRHLCKPTLAKISEELSGVNETVQQNLQQFSLTPYTADPQEFRESLEQWALYFKEIGNMATNAVNGTLEESPLLVAASQAAGFCLLTSMLLMWSGSRTAAVVQSFLVAILVTAGLSWQDSLLKMAAINQGLYQVVGDLRESTMKDLVTRSNTNDEHLQSMLLVTGHLTAIDESPVWACATLPSPFDIEHQTIRTAYHGRATTRGCIPVTDFTLRIAFTMLALASMQVLAFTWRAFNDQLGDHDKNHDQGNCEEDSGDETD